MSSTATQFGVNKSDFPHKKSSVRFPAKFALAAVSGVAFASLTLNVFLLSRPADVVQIEQPSKEFKSGALVMVNPPEVSIYAAGAAALPVGG